MRFALPLYAEITTPHIWQTGVQQYDHRVADPRRLADVYIGTDSEIVSVPGQRDLEARVILAHGNDKERAEAAMAELEKFGTVHKILVFVNSRKQIDTCAGFFRCGPFAKVPVYGHHGSLSKSQREDVEARFKSDSEAICVATMTLEVGIDIGDIDLIVCMDPPFSLSSFLQRIGRGWLPYAFDIGASLAGLLELEASSLAALRMGDDLVVMTWLGRLLNCVLAQGLRKHGVDVADGPFHLAVKGSVEAAVLDLLRETVRDATAKNPLASVTLERMVDVGPHFERLSPTLQNKAREDWLDADFLTEWINGIAGLRIIPADSELGANLLALT